LKVDILKREDLSKRFGYVSKFEAIVHMIHSIPAFDEVSCTGICV